MLERGIEFKKVLGNSSNQKKGTDLLPQRLCPIYRGSSREYPTIRRFAQGMARFAHETAAEDCAIELEPSELRITRELETYAHAYNANLN